MEQASGRIDRMNTPYKDLYYYHIKSRSGIDMAITKALNKKKKFNERKFDYNMWKSTNNNRYKAQYWIDEYERLKSNGELDFIEKYNK